MSLAPDFARSSLQLALELHEVIRESAGSRNMLFSPFLLSSALVGLYNGTRGRTADQIARAAHLGYEEPRQVSTCLPIWHARLFPTWPDSNRRNFEMRHDNCLVYDKGLRLADGYKRWLSRWCRVEAEDFANDPTDGVVFPTRMTAWIGALTSFSCKTPEDASFWTEVDRTTSLFLLSILFIKGKWRHVFHVTRGFFHETPKKSKAAPGTSTPPAADDDGEQQQEEQEKFIVDRPFLFLVMNSEPKAVLLFGSVRKIFAWK
nr:serpin B10-like isoform X2 [Dermacentor andersoni]